jgi:hypothetical protein
MLPLLFPVYTNSPFAVATDACGPFVSVSGEPVMAVNPPLAIESSLMDLLPEFVA